MSSRPHRLAPATLALAVACAAAAAGAATGTRAANLVSGRVTDLAGNPVRGAHVIALRPVPDPLGIAQWTRVGEATTDETGRFRVSCRAAASDVTLLVEHAAPFQRFKMAGVRTGGAPIAITVSRIIDTAYLNEIARETDPARFRARAADLLTPAPGTDGDTLPIPQIVPALAALRRPLRAWLPADPERVKRAQLPQDQDRALRLLALAGDARDDELVKAWLAGDSLRGARPYRPCRGSTIAEAVRVGEDLVFADAARAGYREPNAGPRTAQVVEQAPDGNHAVVMLTFQDPTFQPNAISLVLVRERGTWEIRWVLPGASTVSRLRAPSER